MKMLEEAAKDSIALVSRQKAKKRPKVLITPWMTPKWNSTQITALKNSRMDTV